MNIEKFTLNSSTRIQEAQDRANKEKHNQITPLHLITAMLESTDSLVKDILLDIGVDLQLLSAAIKKEFSKIPRIE